MNTSGTRRPSATRVGRRNTSIGALIEKVCAYDRYVGASLRLIWALGLRRKESVMLRPCACIVRFDATGLPTEEKQRIGTCG